MPSDIGKFVGRYFQTLGVVLIAMMVLSAILLRLGYLDLTPILLFWMAAYLAQHNRTARKWAIGVCALYVITAAAVFIYGAFAGTDRMTLTIGSDNVANPSMLVVAALCIIIAVIFGIPLALLMTPQGRREFQSSERNAK
jgi:quinol-cytochrome oxidoreductase complex cytochrome b subunit